MASSRKRSITRLISLCLRNHEFVRHQPPAITKAHSDSLAFTNGLGLPKEDLILPNSFRRYLVEQLGAAIRSDSAERQAAGRPWPIVKNQALGTERIGLKRDARRKFCVTKHAMKISSPRAKGTQPDGDCDGNCQRSAPPAGILHPLAKVFHVNMQNERFDLRLVRPSMVPLTRCIRIPTGGRMLGQRRFEGNALGLSRRSGSPCRSCDGTPQGGTRIS